MCNTELAELAADQITTMVGYWTHSGLLALASAALASRSGARASSRTRRWPRHAPGDAVAPAGLPGELVTRAFLAMEDQEAAVEWARAARTKVRPSALMS